MNAWSFKRTLVCLIILLYTLLGCKGKTENKIVYKSDFSGSATPSRVGPEFTPYPFEDWQVSNGKLECLVSKENRTVHLLAPQLSEGSFDMEVQVGFYNDNLVGNSKNWAGFNLGADNLGSDHAVHRKGLNIGVSTNGVLFIGTPSPNRKNKNVMKALPTGVNLKVKLRPEANTYKVDILIYDRRTGKLLANISKKHIAKEMLVGGLALVSNFQSNAIGQNSFTKSVWFKDWKIY
ncbi:hypothetical protein QSE00_19130 [Arenibacter sp. M-2]|uniref:hypothetical protein n=1 Tax=Arenibacter sp. M-2 TaxID=3053612 RepID=UPI0025712D8E|nr:hypothetical protein [Arenibacter sp. M-2]MDL5513940.1 hypothetical protein [Arenibacter sp. M-2]